MAIEILEATRDEDKLSPSDLALVELSVNGMLDSDGIARFQQLHQHATKPEGYTAPNLPGIEPLNTGAQNGEEIQASKSHIMNHLLLFPHV